MIAYSDECHDSSYDPPRRQWTKKEIAAAHRKEKREEKLKKEMEKIFKKSCYTNENDWIKPRNFDDIMEDVIDGTIEYLNENSLL